MWRWSHHVSRAISSRADSHSSGKRVRLHGAGLGNQLNRTGLGSRTFMTFAAVVGPLVAFAAAFQTLVFLVLPSRLRSIWAPMTIGTVGAMVTLGAALVFGFDRIGLRLADPGPAFLWAGGTLLAVASVGIVMLKSSPLRERLSDPRVAAWTNRGAVSHILFRIPLMTALIEEAFFRGVLHATLMAVYPPSVAMALGAVLFGLWHIGPAIDETESQTGGPARSLKVALTVVATTVAGAGLVWLRVETGSIWAPFAVHAALNMTMAIFARIASRTDWLAPARV